MEAKDLTKDSRYSLIKDFPMFSTLYSYFNDFYILEAVRNKFRLNRDGLETMWVWLHTVILAKPRTIDRKQKKSTTKPTNEELGLISVSSFTFLKSERLLCTFLQACLYYYFLFHC